MYAKLFASMYQGTLRGDSDGLLVFTNLLAHCDSTGMVDMHPRAISEEVGLPVERVNAALLRLESEDTESRSPEENGKRIIRLDDHRAWGWQVVNHGKYRAIRSEEDRREQNRLAQKRWRERNAEDKQRKQNKPRKPESAKAEAEADTEEKNTARKRAPAAPVVTIEVLVADGLSEDMATDWLAHRKRKRAALTGTAWNSIKAQARKAGYPISQAVETAIRRGWTSFEAEWVEKEVGTKPNGAAAETQEYLAALAAHKAERPSAEVMAKIREVVKR